MNYLKREIKRSTGTICFSLQMKYKDHDIFQSFLSLQLTASLIFVLDCCWNAHQHPLVIIAEALERKSEADTKGGIL